MMMMTTTTMRDLVEKRGILPAGEYWTFVWSTTKLVVVVAVLVMVTMIPQPIYIPLQQFVGDGRVGRSTHGRDLIVRQSLEPQSDSNSESMTLSPALDGDEDHDCVYGDHDHE